jgi:hypothetical protein
MVSLLLAAALAQVSLVPAPGEPAPDALVPDTRGAEAEAKARDDSSRVVQRVALSSAAGVVGAGAGLGIALAFTLPNPNLDARFATTALCTLLVTGGTFLVHQGFGGRGEVMLALLGSIAAMVSANFIASAIDPTVPAAPLLTAAIGALPAAALAVIGLEGSSARARPVKVRVGPTGLSGTF